MIRIAYLINQYPKVSHSFIRREIQALERQGFEVFRVALRGWDAVLLDAEDEIERGRTHYVLRDGALALALDVLRIFFAQPFDLIRALVLAWNMSKRAERPLPFHLAYLAEACRIRLWLRKSHVAHLHAHFGTNSAEVAMLVHAIGGPKWSFTVHGPEEFDKAQLIGLSEKIRNCAFVVAISSYGRSQLYRLVGHDEWSKVHLVHCGLATSFGSNGYPPPADMCLVCVGRLCEQKGQLFLVEAAKRLVDQGIQFRLVLAGDGELRDEIEALIAQYKLESTIYVTGWINSNQVRDEILSARALVLPSFAEGLPVVVMEAMALGRPVISTFVAGIPELVVSGQHGWLIPAGDINALVHAMHACLYASTDALRLLGEEARKRVIVRHNSDTEAAKLAKLFREITKREI